MCVISLLVCSKLTLPSTITLLGFVCYLPFSGSTSAGDWAYWMLCGMRHKEILSARVGLHQEFWERSLYPVRRTFRCIATVIAFVICYCFQCVAVVLSLSALNKPEMFD